ncbi:MAG: DUF3375 domain-containing protein, partial [Xanthomonadales bacterium]|nr:DUF3375 domain-containing protein [Xanthomonadales bacterium]
EWAGPDKGWLRKFYVPGSDEPQFDMAPSTEKAIAWLAALTARSFVGTESRLFIVFDLLRQLSEGTETNVDVRLAELKARRAQIDAEIARVEAGDLALLDETAVRDRFQQFLHMARDLLGDFREVEHNFRQLDRRVRERIALWDGSKGALLNDIMGERDAIADSDQGRSFRAFWDFLMSSRRQQEFTNMLQRVLALPALAAMQAPHARLHRVHYDWLEAGEHTQRTVAELSAQLRRFLDDQAWLENRRIMDILHGIESRALALRDTPPPVPAMHIDAITADIRLPLERPLHTPVQALQLDDVVLDAVDADIDASLLYAQVVIDKAQLRGQVRQALRHQAQVSLGEVITQWPLRHGLAELVAYLQLASSSFVTAVDENVREEVTWQVIGDDGSHLSRQAQLPRIVFVR